MYAIRIINNILIICLIVLPGLLFMLWTMNAKKKVIRFGIILILIDLISFIGVHTYLNKNDKKEVVKVVESEESKELNHKKTVKDGVTYFDGIMIANKTYALPKDYYPKNTYEPATKDTDKCELCIDKTAYNSFLKMQEDAKKEGLNIYIQSGYRSYAYQDMVYNTYVKSDGVEKADTYSSRPGHSEHQTGLAFDLNSVNDSFADTKEGKWVDKNAYKYGFIIRFPKGKDKYTGYKYESWHLRYVGNSLAKKLYNNGNWISLEEYFGITSVYE